MTVENAAKPAAPRTPPLIPAKIEKKDVISVCKIQFSKTTQFYLWDQWHHQPHHQQVFHFSSHVFLDTKDEVKS